MGETPMLRVKAYFEGEGSAEEDCGLSAVARALSGC